jgi:23S rRNA (uracil1939-C5)-methyltransferase
MEIFEAFAGQAPPCRHREMCGGCSYQDVAYQDQLKEKTREVKNLLTGAGLDEELFSSLIPCPNQYRYRNKMEYTFGDEVKGGPLTLGMHKRKSFMSVTYAGECQIVPQEFNEILQATLDFCTDRHYSFYNKKTHEGLLRNLVLRKGFRTGEILVNIVTSSFGEFSADNFKDMILSLDCASSVAGVLHTVNDRVADAVTCDKMEILYGAAFYMEEIMKLRFKVNAFSFFQTNVAAAERLYADALQLIDSLNGKTVYDLYCGSGTITQALASSAAMAIGVEIDPDAVAAARENAALNHLTNCQFIQGDVLDKLADIRQKPDVIVLDPPRAGIHPKAMEMICSYGVPQIVYISCNPKTFIGNIPAAMEKGYKISRLSAYDNFPFTKHIEALCLLEKEI